MYCEKEGHNNNIHAYTDIAVTGSSVKNLMQKKDKYFLCKA